MIYSTRYCQEDSNDLYDKTIRYLLYVKTARRFDIHQPCQFVLPLQPLLFPLNHSKGMKYALNLSATCFGR